MDNLLLVTWQYTQLQNKSTQFVWV